MQSAHWPSLMPRNILCHYRENESLILDIDSLTLPELAGANIGVFAQAGFSEYSMRLVEDLQTINKYAGLGISQSLIPNRLSYFFGLTGPSVAVDAACAGTTYALHQACQSLRNGECSAALVAAGSIISGPEMWVGLASLG